MGTGPNAIVTPSNNEQPVMLTDELLDAIEKRQAAKARAPKAADSGEKAPGLWSLIPKQMRPYVIIAVILFGGSSGTILANASAIWSLPKEVEQLRQEIEDQKVTHEEQGKSLARIEKLLEGPASRTASKP